MAELTSSPFLQSLPAVPTPPCLACLQAVVTLPVQYRMAADIMLLPNALIYNNALRCGTGECGGVLMQGTHGATSDGVC